HRRGRRKTLAGAAWACVPAARCRQALARRAPARQGCGMTDPHPSAPMPAALPPPRPTPLPTVLDGLIAAVVEAGVVVLDVYAEAIAVSAKADASPVTEA